jgi:hypothetical protein
MVHAGRALCPAGLRFGAGGTVLPSSWLLLAFTEALFGGVIPVCALQKISLLVVAGLQRSVATCDGRGTVVNVPVLLRTHLLAVGIVPVGKGPKAQIALSHHRSATITSLSL